MRIVITGGLGQLGLALQKVLADHELSIIDRPDTDITDQGAIDSAIEGIKPELVAHCAALTDVDECARNPEFAYRVNVLGTENVVNACESCGTDLIYISTNEVFAGDRVDGYEEWMPLGPVNTYGRTKAIAETYVRNFSSRFSIVRTAWLYAPGGSNFIHAILQNAKTQGEIRVVVDEVANPTYVMDLAEAIGKLIEKDHPGIYHFTNSGSCSRWAFAGEILRLAGLDQVDNVPILSRDFKRASIPPPYAALLNTAGESIGISLRSWKEALGEFMTSHATGAG